MSKKHLAVSGKKKWYGKQEKERGKGWYRGVWRGWKRKWKMM